MANICKVDGSLIPVEPKDKKNFSLKELQKFVGGLIELIPLTEDTIMVVNEEGTINGMPLNSRVSGAFGYPIFGDVLVCNTNQLN